MKTEPAESLSIKRANIVDKYLPAGDQQRYYQRLEMHEELIALINSHSPKIKQLEWCEEQCPNENINYNHVKVLSPLGVYTIEWKGWKDYDDKTIFLDGVYVSMGGFVLEDAKILAQADFEQRIKECLIIE